MFAVLLLTMGIIPAETVIRDEVSLLERNTYYDGEGRVIFRQIIGYDWDRGRHLVVFWRLEKPEFSVTERPPVVTWNEGDVIRQVRAACFRESWTDYDPELAERDVLPKARRRLLTGERR